MNPAGTPKDLPRWTILSVTTLGAFMAALDSNIVTIALPAISRGLGSGVSLLGWVITGYILATAALVLQSGKMGDLYGKKKVYLVGFALFGFASALCGLSPDALLLIAFRVVQGVGASLIAATSIPLIFASFPPAERGQAVGINSIAWAVGAVAGPLVGGVLTQIDWRLIFYVNVPVAAIAVLVGQRRIPSWLNAKNAKASGLNLLNAAVLGFAVSFVILWLTFFSWWLVPAAALAVIGFVLVERFTKNPLVNRELVHNRGFVFSVLTLGTAMTSFFGVTFVMSFYFQSIAGFSPIIAGLWIAPLPVALAIFNPLGGRLFDRLSRPAFISIIGALIVIASLVSLSFALDSLSPGTVILGLMALIGLGGGLVWAPTVSSALKFARPELRGVANGTAFTLVNIGFATSVALAVSVSAASLPPSLVSQIYLGTVTGLTTAQATLFAAGLGQAMLALAAAGVVGVPILAVVMWEQGKHFRSYEEVPYQPEAEPEQ
jgi:EmrB/QacA subfamily drug resistance transporter